MAQQHHESSFEVEICEYLAEHGWLYSPTDAGYDPELALFPEDVFGWLADTQPEQLDMRCSWRPAWLWWPVQRRDQDQFNSSILTGARRLTATPKARRQAPVIG